LENQPRSKESLSVSKHAIHGDDDEAVRRWEEFQQKNRPEQSPYKS
jgi:hypothetical protein